MLYSIVLLIVMMLFASLAVDLGHVRLAKSQLQDANDAAARYAAWGLRSTSQNGSGAIANATAVFAQSNVDGQAPAFNSATDLELGIWTPATRTFAVATVANGANAVRLSTQMTLGNASHPLAFLSIFGRTVVIHARTVTMINGRDASTYVSAKGNPWLAGMPAGSMSSNFRTNPSEQDYAGSGPNVASSPALVSLGGANITAGSALTFDDITGSASYGGDTSGADGDSALVVNLGSPDFTSNAYFTSSMNGMSNARAPINAVMAVFLNDSAPNSTAAPSTPLDFSNPAARDFTSLSPLLKQVFYVGDGRRANGEIQQFIVPTGATRLFIANMDGWQYNNNTGGYNLSVHATNSVSVVSVK